MNVLLFLLLLSFNKQQHAPVGALAVIKRLLKRALPGTGSAKKVTEKGVALPGTAQMSLRRRANDAPQPLVFITGGCVLDYHYGWVSATPLILPPPVSNSIPSSPHPLRHCCLHHKFALSQMVRPGRRPNSHLRCENLILSSGLAGPDIITVEFHVDLCMELYSRSYSAS